MTFPFQGLRDWGEGSSLGEGRDIGSWMPPLPTSLYTWVPVPGSVLSSSPALGACSPCLGYLGPCSPLLPLIFEGGLGWGPVFCGVGGRQCRGGSVLGVLVISGGGGHWLRGRSDFSEVLGGLLGPWRGW